jgi:outer membrane protein assembly factor BamB
VPDGTAPDPQIMVYKDTVYFSANSSIYAIDGAKGKVRWTYNFPSEIPPLTLLNQTVISNDILYEEMNNKLYAINTADGKLLHTYTLPLQTFASAIVGGDNILYVLEKDGGTGEYDLCAFDLGQGKMQWSRQLAKPVKQPSAQPGSLVGDLQFNNLQVRDGLIVMEVNDSTKHDQNAYTKYIVAFDTRTGAQLWESEGTIVGFHKQSAPWNGSYSVTTVHGVIYYRAPASTILHAYDIHTHKELWQKDIGITTTDDELQTDGTMIYLLASGINRNAPSPESDYHAMGIIAVDATNGAVRWQYPGVRQQMQNNPQVYEKPVLQNGCIYVSIHQNAHHTEMTTYAFTPQGHLLWHAILY